MKWFIYLFILGSLILSATLEVKAATGCFMVVGEDGQDSVIYVQNTAIKYPIKARVSSDKCATQTPSDYDYIETVTPHTDATVKDTCSNLLTCKGMEWTIDCPPDQESTSDSDLGFVWCAHKTKAARFNPDKKAAREKAQADAAKSETAQRSMDKINARQKLKDEMKITDEQLDALIMLSKE